MVTILLYQLFDLPAVGVLLAILIEVEGNFRSKAIHLGCGDIKGTLSRRGPEEGVFGSSFLGPNIDSLGHHEGGIEANTKLTD